MTIAIEDISTTEQLHREALTAVRGGIAYIPVDSPPWDGGMPPFGGVPPFPSFPSGFPFTGFSPVVQPAPRFQPFDPENPLAQ